MEDALDAVLAVLERLKALMTRDETTEAQEEIYRKRHIAVGIPSLYGRYREEKFDAAGMGACSVLQPHRARTNSCSRVTSL